MIHKGEKPYQCVICKLKFREKSNYNFHIKKHGNKSENNKRKSSRNFDKNHLVIDDNINNFCINKNKTLLLEISNNLTNSNSNNISFEKHSKEIKNDIFNIKEADNNSSIVNLNDIYLNKYENKNLFNCQYFNGEDNDFKSFDEQSLECNLSLNNNKNQFLNSDINTINNNNIKLLGSDISSINEEKGINEYNFDDLSIVNVNYDNSYINNTLNQQMKLSVFDNNHDSYNFSLNSEPNCYFN